MDRLILSQVIEPEELQRHLDHPNIRIVDLSSAETHAQFHIQGAINITYARLVRHQTPVFGLLPDKAALNQLFSELGIHRDTHVIAYDDQTGGKASRLLWTLDACGHHHHSLLNGGLHVWATEGYSLTRSPSMVEPGSLRVSLCADACADKDYILQHLDDQSVRFLDVRSEREFSGQAIHAKHGGHIPGAANINWLDLMDKGRAMRLKSNDELTKMLQDQSITPGDEVVTYCQSHHRSAFSYIALKHLGFNKVRGYAGAWSDWGNHDDTPIER
ncbi:MAG TPA: sulfurtransferase [Chromatiaceae bacterium]|jgi:thiosulfate/3-mercaptopyruvate sulfurtransferase|nr:sulfurtransferase [Chromatiaceae bacterium]HIN81968.1 sulfurtransferase [Chromatiales bacterium]HIA08655.1 sulfurtransferase [Chromatiaceae bacterium]HIB83399.1 sulfurtransferase [Chromatiaceae bacterium]HIO14331.1 sulfurtransferase [Chromatiales bacterium]